MSSLEEFLKDVGKRNVFNQFYCQKYVERVDGVSIVASNDMFMIQSNNLLVVKLDNDKIREVINDIDFFHSTKGGEYIPVLNPVPSIFETPTLVGVKNYNSNDFLDFWVSFVGFDKFTIPVVKIENFSFDEDTSLVYWQSSFYAVVVDEPEFKTALMQFKLIFG